MTLAEDRFTTSTRALWKHLAHTHGYPQLPQGDVRLTTGGLERWLHRLGMSKTAFLDWCGLPTLREYVKRNADWPLVGVVGLLLEEKYGVTEEDLRASDLV